MVAVNRLLEEHRGYVTDPVRLARFKAAIDQTIRPGDRVVDLGCGTAILGLLCLEAGAGHVQAIDSTAMIEVARKVLRNAGFEAQSECLHGDCGRIRVDEPVDVLVCDHVGYFGFDYGIVELLDDARRRMLKPGGAIIPRALSLSVAAVESDSSYQLAEAWCNDEVSAHLHWLRDNAINSKYAVTLKPQELLGAPARLGRIDFHEDNPDFQSWSTSLRIARDGSMHGLGGWFDCELADGIEMTNSPLATQRIDREQVFLPLEAPLPVRTGEILNVSVMARPAEQLLTWEVESLTSGRKFRQSTWQGMLLRPQDLRSRQANHVPRLSDAGRARSVILEYCNGTRTVGEIVQAVERDHPDLLPSTREISSFVAAVLARDSE